MSRGTESDVRECLDTIVRCCKCLGLNEKYFKGNIIHITSNHMWMGNYIFGFIRNGICNLVSKVVLPDFWKLDTHTRI